MKWFLGLVLFLFAAPASRALCRVIRAQPLKEAPPAELSEEIATQIAPSGWKVMQGEKRVVCEIWPAKAWAAKADFEPSDTVLVPLQPGSLVGVLRFTAQGEPTSAVRRSPPDSIHSAMPISRSTAITWARSRHATFW